MKKKEYFLKVPTFQKFKNDFSNTLCSQNQFSEFRLINICFILQLLYYVYLSLNNFYSKTYYKRITKAYFVYFNKSKLSKYKIVKSRKIWK